MNTPSIILASALILIPENATHVQAAAANNAGHAVMARSMTRLSALRSSPFEACTAIPFINETI